jgi:hypothetical protein
MMRRAWCAVVLPVVWEGVAVACIQCVREV